MASNIKEIQVVIIGVATISNMKKIYIEVSLVSFEILK